MQQWKTVVLHACYALCALNVLFFFILFISYSSFPRRETTCFAVVWTTSALAYKFRFLSKPLIAIQVDFRIVSSHFASHVIEKWFRTFPFFRWRSFSVYGRYPRQSCVNFLCLVQSLWLVPLFWYRWLDKWNHHRLELTNVKYRDCICYPIEHPR